MHSRTPDESGMGVTARCGTVWPMERDAVMETVSDTSEWWMEYRNPFNPNWARTMQPFASKEAAESTYKREVEVPQSYWIDLQIVEVRTVVTKSVIVTQRVPGTRRE